MITYRANSSGTLQAAYLGSVRVGYIENKSPLSPASRWLWQTIFIAPEGGAYVGKEDHEEDAKEELLKAVNHWLACAGLSLQGKLL